MSHRLFFTKRWQLKVLWNNLCLLVAFFMTTPLLAQNQQIYFEHLTSEDGLSENVINCIYQDSHGFMWFGTNDGLNKFDGYNFTIYRPDRSKEGTISSNLIFTITEDFHNRLWVGTTGQGLNYFDLATQKVIVLTHQPDNPNSISSNHILKLLTDRNGNIWVATDNGLDLITFNEDKEPKISHLLTNTQQKGRIIDLFEDKKGSIWIGARNGLFKVIPTGDNDNFSFKSIPVFPDKPSITHTIREDKYGHLIVGTTRGVFLQDDTKDSFTKIYDINTHSGLVIDRNDKIWVGSYRGLFNIEFSSENGVAKLAKQYTTSLDNPNTISDNVIRSLFIDNKDVIWVGTNGGGINFFDPNRKPFEHHGKKLKKNGQDYTKIRSILEDSNGYIWVGTEGGGLFYAKDRAYDSMESIVTNKRPFALAEVRIGTKKYIWVGSENSPAIHQIDITDGSPSTVTRIPFKKAIFAINQDQNGQIWIGTYASGVHRWKPLPNGDFQKHHFPYQRKGNSGPASNIIRKIIEDNQGNIWIGTGNGLNRIAANQTESNQPVFDLFQQEDNNRNSLSHNYILDIYESSIGELWIGTFGGGLNKLSPYSTHNNNQILAYGENDGFPNASIKGILEDGQGNLWVASNKGLTQFNPIKQTTKNYYNSSGLQSFEFIDGAAFKRRDGELLFGGVNGFNAFYPENIIESKIPPRVVFTCLEVLNKTINVGDNKEGRIILPKVLSELKEIQLKYYENNFSVEFAGLDYASADRIKYQHQLENFDTEWIHTEAKSRKATYTNLRPGKYKLKVKAANQDGYWAKESTMLEIVITPPWYLTIPAYITYFLLFLGLLYLFRRYELINIQEKHQLTLERNNKEKREELNQMKLRFFTNISHELKTPLTLIIAPLEQLLQKSRKLQPEEIQQQYHFMYKNSKYLLRTVNQLLDFQKLDQGKMQLTARPGDIVAFIKEISEPFQFLANKEQINFKVESDEVGLFIWFDANFIEKIIYNLLSNAFKFTPKGGNITIQFTEISPMGKQFKKSKSKHFLEISIKDSGPGMSSKVAKKVFQRFFKADGEHENQDGAGIGLAYTKSLVERHYGSIDLKTKIGKGATFSVILPMDREAFGKQEINRTPIQQFDRNADPLEYFMPEPLAGMDKEPNLELAADLPQEDLPLLLFIDDNADIRKFIQTSLENDFRVIVAENGKIGYDLALSSMPDLIISDIMMPEMDGIELCNTLKANQNTSHIPILLLTAKTNEESELEGLQTGADAYVKKPFKLDILKMQLLNIHRQREKMKDRFRKEIILQPSEVTVTSVDEEFLQLAVSLVEEHMDDSEFNVEALVKEMFISRSRLYLKIKALTGQSTSEFIRTVRLKRAVQLLEASDYTIKEIMYRTGFNTASYFSKCFKQQFGIVPSEYVREQKRIRK